MSAREGRSQAWIAANEASHRIAARFGGLTRAQHALALGLREGLLDAAAKRADVSLGHDDEFIEEQAPQGELLGIDPEHWPRSEIWESDRLRWDWAAGDFEIHNIETGETYLFYGVHFLEEQVEALDPSSPAFGSLLPKTPQEPAGAKRGPKTKTHKWGALIGALLELERDNRLRAVDYPDVSSLLRAIRTKMRDPELWLDERTMEGVLAYVWYNHLEGLPNVTERN